MRNFYFLLLITSITFGQSAITPGMVHPKVKQDPTSNKTYAIYLPRDYDAQSKYPVVFVFDEKGRGDLITQQFSIGAALTSSIVIGANYELDSTIKPALKQMEELINRSYDEYAIDRDKIILAGFGYASLVTSTSAQLSNSTYGLIAVGDAFLDKKLLSKNPKLKVSILSPDEGKQFYKLRAYGTGYSLDKFIKGYHVYDGGDLPESGYLATALTDILIDEDVEKERLQQFYDTDMAFADLLYKKQKHVYAYNFVTALKDKYKKILDIDSQKELAKEIRFNKAFRAKRDRSTVITYGEGLLAEDFKYYLAEDTQKAFFDNLGWWSYQMDELDVKIDSTASSKQERKAAIRLKGFVQNSVEQQYEIVKAQNSTPEKLLFVNILRTLVNPSNQDAFIQVIGLSAREGDTNASLFYLEELLKSGYTDYDNLYAIPYTTALRIGPEWNEIIKDYLGKSKYY
ncbi:MAG: hypothetical protein ACJAZZ_000033 [Dokdonia donghaensis]|jgi:hypothetical protein